MTHEELEIQRNRNLVKSTTHSMPHSAEVGVVARRRMENSESAAQIRSVTTDPKINPAGKGRFTGAYAPFNDRSHHYTYAGPDASHAARLRGQRSRTWQQKAQGK